jgi:protein-disulfide isomerase
MRDTSRKPPPICYNPRRRDPGAPTKSELSMSLPLRITPLLLVATVLLFGAAPLPMWAPPALAEEFTPAQRAEIVAIVREALKRDPSILRDAVIALQTDDGEREKSETRAAVSAARDTMVNPNDPIGGNPHGNVTIVEFFDVRCPYCRKLEPEMSALLNSDHDVRLVYKDLPILGPASVLGTKALLAARKQNAYEKLRDVVMRMPPDITRAGLEAEAKKLGLDSARLLHDMDDPSIQQQIDTNLRLAKQLNIQGTPAMVVGGDLLPGAVDVAELKQAVADARAKK